MFKFSTSSVVKQSYLPVLQRLKCRELSSEVNLPAQADVVVIGGGVIGCSTLYHLTKRGINAVLLEKNKITSGTTWHSSGLIRSLGSDDVAVQLFKSTRKLYGTLEKETGLETGWNNCGSLAIARTHERLEEYKRFHTLGHFFNVESRLISSSEAKQVCPLLDPIVIRGALHCPSDGYTDPGLFCHALIKAAMDSGAKVYEHCPVVNILVDKTEHPKIIGVETNSGFIKTGCIVNATGMWASKITQMVGLQIPITVMKHSHIVTESIPEFKGSPCIRDPDGSIYFRPHGDHSILLGGFERNPEILTEVPEHFHFGTYNLDKNNFNVHWKRFVELCPPVEKVKIKSELCGTESFTPDHKPIMGEDPRLLGLYHACGFNSFGMQLSGGAGEQMAAWIALGRPELPMHQYDIRRFTPLQRTDKAWVTETSHESYACTYAIGYKHSQSLSGRNHRIDPFQEALVANGAVMEQCQGWERPGYFVKHRTAPVRGYDWYGQYGHIPNIDQRYFNELEGDNTFGFSKHHDLIREETLAARNNVVVFNTSCFTKMYLTGRDAPEAADWLFTADVDREPGSVVYTCTLNSRGGVEADVTVIPLKEGGGTLVGPILKGKGYYIVAGGESGHLTKCHLRKQLLKKNFRAIISVTTDKIGVLSIQGPKSGELLQSITESPITDERFPRGMSQVLKIGGHTCRALRISYIGELGYELHIPTASCLAVYHKVVEAGRGFEMRHAGFRALDSLNCEKGYHLLNHDLRMDDNPVEANLGRHCRKEGQYLGKPHVERMKQEGVKKKRVFFTLSDKIALHGFETIWRDDTIVGFLRRGEFGYNLDCSIGIGYVTHPQGDMVNNEFLTSGNYEIEVRNKRFPATLYLNSPFDPKNQRPLGIYEHQFQEQTHFED